jgi:hypothetical protein
VVSLGLAIVVYGSIAVIDFMTAKPPRKKANLFACGGVLIYEG